MADKPIEEVAAEKLKELDKLKRKVKEKLSGGRGRGRPRKTPFVSVEDDYERHKADMARRSRERSKIGQEIGELPQVRDPVRKSECGESLELFATTYLPETFYLPFADMHRQVIHKIETVVRKGGLFAQAMPRGSGKTSAVRAASLWAILYGYRRYVYFVASNATMAKKSLDAIKSWIFACPRLLEDFPEAVYPLIKLDREPKSCTGQRYQGEPTLTQWLKDCLVFPTIPGSKASGAVFNVSGLTSGFRGADFAHPSGGSVRPDLVIPDDPQTDASAKSDRGCEERENLIAGAVLGLAGPNVRISAIMPCTVIRQGDLADRMLDVKKHPEWNGSRFPLVKSFPADVERWAKYKELLVGFNPDVPGDNVRAETEATDYYRDNHEAMVQGSELTWPERFTPDCIDALQYAMNLQIRDSRAFWSEYQNQPVPKTDDSAAVMKPHLIAAKLNNTPRYTAPPTVTRLTMGIDVQKNVLYYTISAWEENFTGYVIDYGTYPDQRFPYFRCGEVQNTLAKATGVQGEEGQVYAGLAKLCDGMLGKDWRVGTSGVARIERCVIDAGYLTETVYQYCRQATHATVITPAFGRSVQASQAPMALWKLQPGERRGMNWVIKTAEKRALKFILWDTNFWKTFLHQRLWVSMGSGGCLSLFGSEDKVHRMYSDHLVSERPTAVTANGRTVDKWEMKVGADNHFLDTTLMSMVAASIQGVSLTNVHKPTAKPQGPQKKFSEQYAEKRLARERAGM